MISKNVMEDIKNYLYEDEYKNSIKDLWNMDTLSDDIIKGLIKVDHLFIIDENPEICPERYSQDILHIALDEGKSYAWILTHLDQFDWVDLNVEERIISRLLGIYEESSIAQNIDKLKYYDKSKLIEQLASCYTGIIALVGNIDHFPWVDTNMIANKLLDFGEKDFLMNNYECLKWVDDKNVVDRLIDENIGRHQALSNITKFTTIDPQYIVDKIMENGPAYLISNNLYSIQKVKVDMRKIFEYLCIPDMYDELVGKLEYFPNIDKTVFAKKLITEWYAGSVAFNLEKFEWVSEEILEQARAES